MTDKLYKFKHIWVEMFGANIYYICCPRAHYIKAIKREFGEEAPEKKDNVLATCEIYTKIESKYRVIKGTNYIDVIWHNNKCSKDMPSIVHEVFHAVHNICQRKGLWLTDSSEETYAYMIQWVLMEIIRLRKRK